MKESRDSGKGGLLGALEELLGSRGLPRPRLKPPLSGPADHLMAGARACRWCGKVNPTSAGPGRGVCMHCDREL